ncbi:MAG TPA: divergent polysaccharide deacetylase family protein [Rhizobiales bacterium]|nr:divergent polysaccharide deacetylase family protein [Hyphomicrobiales bacterium]
MQEDLRQPLKRRTLADRLGRLKPSGLQAASMLAVVVMLAGGVWLYRQDIPLAGQPVVVSKIGPLEKISTASTPAKKTTGIKTPGKSKDQEIADRQIPPEPDPVDLAADRATARQRLAIIQRPGRMTVRPLRRAPVKAVSERGPYGPLPKIARNGKRPFDVYSSKVSRAVLQSGKPKIVLVIGGMGINAKLTNQAIRELPGQITFAFAPYGRNLQGMINKARQRGHEVILHLPMEPFGYPGINPGPKTLLASAEPLDNLKNLKWLLSRFSGYSGVTNYMGAKFTKDGGALLPVFSQIKGRGLVYFDDASNGQTLTGSIARAANLPSRTADLTIGGDESFTIIQRKLSNLEALARKNGLAIGTGTGLATTIDAVESWSRDLQDRGIILVPLSVAYRGARS